MHGEVNMLVTLFLVFCVNFDATQLLKKGEYSDLHVKFVAQNLAVVGFALPFGTTEKTKLNEDSTYTLLLVELKKGTPSINIVNELNLPKYKGKIDNFERSSIFEIAPNRGFLLVKPLNSPDLHVVIIQETSLLEIEKFKGNANQNEKIIVSVLIDQFQNSILITSVLYEKDYSIKQSEVDICEFSKKGLNVKKTLVFKSLLDETIYKACPLGDDLIVFLTKKRIFALNTATNKIEENEFIFDHINKPGWKIFLPSNGWINKLNERSGQLFINVPGENLATFELDYNGKIFQVKKNKLINLFENTSEIGIRYAEKDLLIFWNSEKSNNMIALRKDNKEKVVFKSPQSFSYSAPSLLLSDGIILIQQKGSLTLVIFSLNL